MDARTTWGVGDYPRMGAQLECAAADVVARAGIGPGDRVVDVATGTGNAARLAAGLGADVVGIDFEPALLLLAQERAPAPVGAVRWMAGDVTALPVADGAAEVVLSVFGVMYAPDHDAAARELSRVAAPGARVVLASWCPDGVLPTMGRVLGPYLPAPPAGSAPPSRWGDPEALAGLLEPHGLWPTSGSVGRVTLAFDDTAEAVEFFLSTAGHVVSEQDRLVREGRWARLRQELGSFVDWRGTTRGHRLVLELDYLVAGATKGPRRWDGAARPEVTA